MKVICINSGNQVGEFKVHVGSIYTVIKIVYGWEVYHIDTIGIFYDLAEMQITNRVYHSKMFANLSEIDEMELINEKEMIS